MRGIERNIRLYPWHAAAFRAYFWLPVFFLFFSERFSVAEVLLLEACYYAAMFTLEVPSGYFSDAVGRRLTLLISSAAMIVAYALFFSGSQFATFVTAQVCLAVGFSFISGTDSSFHYDSLAALGRADEFGAREARAARYAFLATALAAFLGGMAGSLQLRLTYGLSLAAALLPLGMVFLFVEPPRAESEKAPGFLRQLRRCLGCLANPALAWLFAFAVLMTVLNHVPHMFYQPYLDALVLDLDFAQDNTAWVAGMHTAAAMLAGSWAASRSMRLRDRFGVGPLLLSSTLLQTAIIAAMCLLLHPLLALLFLLRTVPRGLMTAPLLAATIPLVPRAQRATYLSMQSLAGRSAFSGLLFGLSLIADRHAHPAWQTLSFMLLVCVCLGLAGLIALLLTMPSSLGKAATRMAGTSLSRSKEAQLHQSMMDKEAFRKAAAAALPTTDDSE